MNWRTEKRKIKDLIPADYNPRILPEAQKKELGKSLKKFNVADPIIINTNNKIIGGHQRLKVLTEQGVKEVDVRVPEEELTPDQEKELNLRLNRNIGEWDYDLLAGFDKALLEDVGFDSFELDKIFRPEERPDDDDAPEVPKDPKAKQGEIYQLGDHRVMCGDSTNSLDVEKLMNGEKAQMCFTDPPYNVDYTGGMGTHKQNKRSGIMNDKMEANAFAEFLGEISARITENVTGGVYICMSSSELDTLKQAWEGNGGHWQSFIIWVKNNFTLSRADYQHTYEPILYGWPKGIKNHYFVNDRARANVWEDLRSVKSEYKDGHTTISFQGFKIKLPGKVESGEVIKKKQRTNIWRHDKPTRSAEHPTMKPVALCTEGIMGSSKRGDIVLDLFLGSGSTLIAADKIDRKCYGMELDPGYMDVIIQRWENYTQKKAVKLGK